MEKSLPLVNNRFANVQTVKRMKSITEIYDTHINTVYRVCFSLMGNVQDAEDATQSVFIKLMESDKIFVDSEHEKAWLITVARNHCRDLHRKWWRKKVVDIDPSSIEQGGMDTAQNMNMMDYLGKLPKKYRLVIYLYYYEGYSVTEIANILKLNINTVKTQMRSARKRLKLEVGDDFHE
ncbi:sigma-70 family RNA polymerase sigma factor [Bacillus sp. FJAT-50079]|uniref:RNA polymerase sigma factor n=1 Tax=Bacillus sp. FJAT-50079 TaxID=2833577 RepID=UPI001BCA1529|nr:sigma-70 family RNA polymerase sigma factor [Bacillus sp. FJAT-50079]MBS4208570.1 sigma-70 family RNA polymerase sigma factor [Bacillus sp. FJAT-50079]